ncbi:unnamed protein product [Notodromas monacha]|uniref:LRAT domain-containing protein n=1 Tax=Notodromas monacha TaxID=399045 RepID=A0A7R9BRY2_9CRUS|nr:unnamed protein product [Notodromas monacha]CAG0919220.1 unnamed protein product [Notodromas monacha]
MAHVSKWHKKFEYEDLKKLLKPGDLVEFHRGTYKHWAVFVGSMRDFCGFFPAGFQCEFCRCCARRCQCSKLYLVHRANAGETNALNFFARSESYNKGIRGVGNVILEVIDDVCDGCEVRKNNFDDAKLPKGFCTVMVLKRAFKQFSKHATGDVENDEYNLVVNNCEHFASWCRYGAKSSSQIKNGALTLGVTTVLAAAVSAYALTPRKNAKKAPEENVSAYSNSPFPKLAFGVS